MVSFSVANQVRLMLKMKLSNYYWYNSSLVVPEADGWSIVVTVKKLDNRVRKVISPVIEGVSIKTEVE